MNASPLLAAGLAAAIVTLGARGAIAAPAAVQLPTLLSVTGSAAFIGKEALESVRLIVAQRNAAGGVRGRQLDVALTDTGSQPLVALQAMNRVKAGASAAVFGPTFTAVCNAVAPLVNDGPVVSCFSPGVHPKPGSFMFSAGVGSGGMAQALATYFHDRNWHRIGMISSIDASGQDFASKFDAVMAQQNNADLHLVLPGALSWDPTELLLDAYQALGWDASPEQLRAWISSQHAWAGINGIYDFATIPQRGIGVDSCVIDRWDEAAKAFVAVSSPGGHIRHQRRFPV